LLPSMAALAASEAPMDDTQGGPLLRQRPH
jgi:hypothetical protein